MINAARHLISFLVLLAFASPAFTDWPGFRGPNGLAVSPDRGLPLKWSSKENLLWKAKLPGPGSSSPVVLGKYVFVTCWSGYGTPTDRGEMEKLTRHLICLDRSSGEKVWQKDVPAKVPESDAAKMVREHGYATHTPVTDGERLYVFFGRTGVFAYDLSGKELWSKEVGKGTNSFGSAASPILYKNLVIVNAAVESASLIALDKLTGKEVWRVKGLGDCWATPLLVETPAGKTELVLNGPAVLEGYDPEKGGEALWTCETQTTSYFSSMPLFHKGLIYVMNSGSDGRNFLAIRPGGKGDVTATHLVWRQKVGASYCSPVVANDHLYFFSQLATCLRADTGQVVFQERLPGLGTEYASPVVADGRIYLFTRTRKGFVLAAKDKLEILATNELDDAGGFIASPAVSGGRIFVRTNEYLYCLGERGN